MKYPIKVLYVYGDTLRLGGIEQVMLSYFRGMDRNVVHIDFALQGNEEGIFDREILSAGSRIFRLPKPGKHPVRFYIELARLIRKGGYRIVHGHCDAMNCRVMHIAMVCGVPVRIAHSHNTEHILASWTRYWFYEHCRKYVGVYATERWACSDAAGRWLFGDRPYRVFPNAIDLERFAFRPEKRDALRARLGIGRDEIVLGHVGRFHAQKNHEFLVELLAALNQNSSKYRLLMVGGGDRLESIQDMTMIRGVRDKAIFVGGVDNPEDYYNAMDLFVLPSLFEGFGLVIVEAEANGLKCIVSDHVPKDAAVSGRAQFCPLETDVWTSAVLSIGDRERQDCLQELRDMNMDIHAVVKEVQNAYVRLCEEAENMAERAE